MKMRDKLNWARIGNLRGYRQIRSFPIDDQEFAAIGFAAIVTGILSNKKNLCQIVGMVGNWWPIGNFQCIVTINSRFLLVSVNATKFEIF